MKRYFIALVMVLVSMMAVFAATSSGVGSPYSLTPTAIGDLYQNTLNGSVWRANSTTKGDWTELTPVIADGSANAPFTLMTAEKLVVGVDAVSILTATAAAPLDSAILNVTTTATGDVLNVADGVEGQLLTVFYNAQGHATDSLVITPANLASGTTVTLANLSERAVMVFTDAEWYVIYTNGTVE